MSRCGDLLASVFSRCSLDECGVCHRLEPALLNNGVRGTLRAHRKERLVHEEYDCSAGLCLDVLRRIIQALVVFLGQELQSLTPLVAEPFLVTAISTTSLSKKILKIKINFISFFCCFRSDSQGRS